MKIVLYTTTHKTKYYFLSILTILCGILLHGGCDKRLLASTDSWKYSANDLKKTSRKYIISDIFLFSDILLVGTCSIERKVT